MLQCRHHGVCCTRNKHVANPVSQCFAPRINRTNLMIQMSASFFSFSGSIPSLGYACRLGPRHPPPFCERFSDGSPLTVSITRQEKHLQLPAIVPGSTFTQHRGGYPANDTRLTWRRTSGGKKLLPHQTECRTKIRGHNRTGNHPLPCARKVCAGTGWRSSGFLISG